MRNRQLASSLVLVLIVLFLSTGAFAQVIIVRFAPPALPVYTQPLCPAENYMWVPGYWAWDPDFLDYFWVPGTWVLAPERGYLWTPGYWAWNGSGFMFNQGYWAPVVGYYGGINYGYGYFGRGYEGGRWDHDRFYYNRAVNNVNETNIHNVYNTTVNNVTVNRVSYNGGPGGVTARPNPQEQVPPERRLAPVEAQTRHLQTASSNQELRASVNQGKPPVAATQKPGSFNGGSVVPAQQAGGPYHPPANRAAANPPGAEQQAHPQNQVPNYAHAKDVPQHQQPTPRSNQADAKAQQQYGEQQQLQEQQNREHEQMAQQQEREHQQAQQQHANQAQMQQMEQEHQQQTQRMEQQHMQQQRQMQERQAPPAHAAPAPQPHGAPTPHS